MTKPTIELRKIQLAKNLSEETPAYTAQLWVDGKHFCDVQNQGHGGCDMYHAVKGVQKNVWDEVAALDARIKATYPKIDVSDIYRDGQKHEMDESVETICHGLVWDSDLVKTVKRDLSKKVMWVSPKDGKIYQIKLDHPSHREPAIAAVKSKHGVAKTLNEMTIDEAVAAYKSAA